MRDLMSASPEWPIRENTIVDEEVKNEPKVINEVQKSEIIYIDNVEEKNLNGAPQVASNFTCPMCAKELILLDQVNSNQLSINRRVMLKCM